jgi:enamine deaminase RidA (YjgF/YER057c/UK114 family)
MIFCRRESLTQSLQFCSGFMQCGKASGGHGDGDSMARSSIYVGEIAHQSPIPNACRIGNIIVSSLIRGFDPATGKLAATLEQQCVFMFLHLRQTVEAGGATVEDIVKVTFWMEKLQRKVVNDEWIRMFPDPASRPARQIMEVPMEAGVLLQCDFMAAIAAG